ncbi:MAG: BON domain-containing protein [Armatimonadota bacterium]|jgi:osmotically-inducible protein OsmY
MRPDDAMLTRRVRSEIIRRELDTQKLEVKVMHGVAYLAGELRPTRAQRITDWRKEMEIIENIVYGISGIRGIDNRIKWVEI